MKRRRTHGGRTHRRRLALRSPRSGHFVDPVGVRRSVADQRTGGQQCGLVLGRHSRLVRRVGHRGLDRQLHTRWRRPGDSERRRVVSHGDCRWRRGCWHERHGERGRGRAGDGACRVRNHDVVPRDLLRRLRPQQRAAGALGRWHRHIVILGARRGAQAGHFRGVRVLEDGRAKAVGQRFLDPDHGPLGRSWVDGRRWRRRGWRRALAGFALGGRLLALRRWRRLHLDATNACQHGLDFAKRERALERAFRSAGRRVHVHVPQIRGTPAVGVGRRHRELHLDEVAEPGRCDVGHHRRSRPQRRQRWPLLPTRHGDREHTDEESTEQKWSDGTHGPPIVLCGRRRESSRGQRGQLRLSAIASIPSDARGKVVALLRPDTGPECTMKSTLISSLLLAGILVVSGPAFVQAGQRTRNPGGDSGGGSSGGSSSGGGGTSTAARCLAVAAAPRGAAVASPRGRVNPRPRIRPPGGVRRGCLVAEAAAPAT